MSKLEELIKELCPDGVEYGTLDDLTIKAYSGGTPLANNSQYYGGDIPWLRTQEVRFADIHNTKIKITPLALANSSAKWIPENCVIIAISGATAGRSAINKIALTTNQHCCCLEINPKKAIYRYVFHWVYCQYENIKALGRGAREDLNASIIKGYPIPIPPLPIQEEIVRILDKFNETQTELINQLQVELITRKQQYEYCRDSLLTFGDDVELKLLDSVCLKTNNISWENNKEKTFYYIDLSSVDRELHIIKETIQINAENAPSRAQKIISENDIIFGATRPLLKRFCKIPFEFDNHICSTGFCILRAKIKEVLPDFLYYQISKKEYYDYIELMQKGVAYPAVSDSDIKKYKIPIPSLLEQERIVTILDNLDNQITEITQKLSEEISARKQQYEYYRDTLLTFKEL